MLQKITVGIALLIWVVFMGFILWMCFVLATPVPPDFFGDERDYPHPHKGLIQQPDLDAIR
jgi:hypothetical protein